MRTTGVDRNPFSPRSAEEVEGVAGVVVGAAVRVTPILLSHICLTRSPYCHPCQRSAAAWLAMKVQPASLMALGLMDSNLHSVEEVVKPVGAADRRRALYIASCCNTGQRRIHVHGNYQEGGGFIHKAWGQSLLPENNHMVCQASRWCFSICTQVQHVYIPASMVVVETPVSPGLSLRPISTSLRNPEQDAVIAIPYLQGGGSFSPASRVVADCLHHAVKLRERQCSGTAGAPV
jgi:hypothetical protein